MRLVFVALLLCFAADAQLQDVRIALRLGTDHILIVGGELMGSVYDKSMESLPKEPGYSPLQPIEQIFRVPADYAAKFHPDPETRWHVGDRWKIYTSAGAPVPVSIDSLAVGYYCGGIGGYTGALAHFENPSAENLVGGLRSGEYLAAPATWIETVSEQPLEPFDPLHENDLANAIEQDLLERGRRTVRGAQWKADTPQAHEMDRAFLDSDNLKYDARIQRWRRPGQKSVLFVEAVWTEKSGRAIFGSEAVIEEGDKPIVIAFDPKLGELMRVPETLGTGGWTRPESGIFLNAWSIGNRRFVLRATHGYEGFRVGLLQLVPGQKMVPAGISFGAGC